MAQIWDSAREAFANGEVAWLTDTIVVAIVDDTYVFDPLHSSPVDLGASIQGTQPLSGKTNVGGVLDADDVIFPAVAPGDTIAAVVVYHDGTGQLLVHYDLNASAEPISVATTGGSVTIAWSNGPFKMFRI